MLYKQCWHPAQLHLFCTSCLAGTYSLQGSSEQSLTLLFGICKPPELRQNFCCYPGTKWMSDAKPRNAQYSEDQIQHQGTHSKYVWNNSDWSDTFTVTFEEVISWLSPLRKAGIAAATLEMQPAATAAARGNRNCCSESSLCSNSPFLIALFVISIASSWVLGYSWATAAASDNRNFPLFPMTVPGNSLLHSPTRFRQLFVLNGDHQLKKCEEVLQKYQ